MHRATRTPLRTGVGTKCAAIFAGMLLFTLPGQAWGEPSLDPAEGSGAPPLTDPSDATEFGLDYTPPERTRCANT